MLKDYFKDEEASTTKNVYQKESTQKVHKITPVIAINPGLQYYIYTYHWYLLYFHVEGY